MVFIFSPFNARDALVLGDVFAAQDSGVYSYLFHLYYDNGKLTVDKDFNSPFDLIAQDYQSLSISGAVSGFSFSGELFSVKGNKIADFGISTVLIPFGGKGKISSYAPYLSNAKKAIFYDFSGTQILEIDVAPGGAVCNEDEICNADTGEDSQNCPADCKIALTPTPTEISKPAPSLLGRIFSLTNLIGLAIVAALVWLFLWLKNKKQNVETPTQI